MTTDLIIKKFKPQEHYVKALVYGKSGTGKTVFGGLANDVIIASAEDWLLSLNAFKKDIPYTQITSVDDMRSLFTYLRDEKHWYKSLVIDSLTEISDKIKLNIEKKNGGKQLSLPQWWEISRAINEIIMDFKTLPLNLLIITQEIVEKDEEKVLTISPALNGQMKTKIGYSMDVVWYLYTKEVKDENGVILFERHCKTSMSEKLITKDRTGLIGDRINITFQDWIDLAQGMVTEEKEEIVTEVKAPAPSDVVEDITHEFAELTNDILSKPDPKKLNANKMKLVQVMTALKKKYAIVNNSPEHIAMVALYEQALVILSPKEPE